MRNGRSDLRRLFGLEANVLLGILLVVAGIWFFAVLAREVTHGDTLDLDRSVLRALRRADDPAVPVGPVWVQGMARDLTSLGSWTLVSLFTLAVVGFLLLQRRFGWIVLVAFSVGGAGALDYALKALFGRVRPDVVPHLQDITGPSFPSGHTMISAATYLTLGALVARLNRRRWTRVYVLCVALALTFLVGISRVYLGVHYPTDVLGGWTAGLVWASSCVLAARALERRRMVEPAPAPSREKDGGDCP